jgi:hypothetical protein
MKTTLFCLECGKHLTEGVHDFSVLVYGHPLCMSHQTFIAESGVSPRAIDLYLALKSRDLPVALEYFDGHKHVDIALPGKLYIEINGSHHYDSMQALADLNRSVYSLQENISTIAVPNYLLNHPETFRLTVEELAKACRSLLAKSSFWELAHSLRPVQLQ